VGRHPVVCWKYSWVVLVEGKKEKCTLRAKCMLCRFLVIASKVKQSPRLNFFPGDCFALLAMTAS
jgi:hypothetical protein